MNYNTLLIEKSNGVAKVKLNRPPLNAVNEELLDELSALCEELDKDKSIHVVIITGAGKTFSAGRELTGILERKEYPGGPRYASLEKLSKPVIAAVKGYCFTGSFELAMCADIIIASEDAVFGDTHARFGITPGGGQTQRLPRLIGTRKAKELLFTCARLSANEAKELGIVNKVVSPEMLEEESEKMAKEILKNIPETISIIKFLINQSMNSPLEEGLSIEKHAHQGRPITPTPEGKKRVEAFLSKNKK
jgi:enoyl-CoA hydratase/carnithine racemase